jgi:carbonic anhydrase
MFVHRNVANQAPPQDANYLSVLHYAVNILKVKHVLVVGHYGCGGVKASIESKDHGLIDHWLSPIREIAHNHHDELSALNDTDRVNRLVELNVIAQVRNVASNPITQNAWRDNRELHVHGWVYALHDGLIKDLGVSASNIDQRRAVFGI